MPSSDTTRVLFHRFVRLNVLLFSSILGLVSGALVVLCTLLVLAQGKHDSHLALLAVFLPGYTVSPGGALVGFFWAALVGGLCGALIYIVYIRSTYTSPDGGTLINPRDGAWEAPMLVLDGHFLGVGLGLTVGVLLFAATAWLVMRGTAPRSIHAGLLAYYLPGYRVNMGGASLGAVEIFAVAYCLSRIFSGVYNHTLALRRRRRS